MTGIGVPIVTTVITRKTFAKSNMAPVLALVFVAVAIIASLVLILAGR